LFAPAAECDPGVAAARPNAVADRESCSVELSRRFAGDPRMALIRKLS
jgi:hypothetical protein